MLDCHGKGIPKSFAACGAAVLVASACGCMTYRGPRGLEATIERKAAVELHREMGFKLGPVSTKLAAAIVHDWAEDQDLRDLSGIGVAVFEVRKHRGDPTQPITAKDLGVEGWRPMVESRSEGEQILVLAKPVDDELREMIFLSIDRDEVVVARLKGHLDRLIEKTVAAADVGGAGGARAAIGFGAE